MSLGLKLKQEYKSMTDRWERGDLYYHLKQYIRTYTKYPVKAGLKKYICTVLAIARVGLPITSSLVAWLANVKIDAAHSELEHLTSLNIVDPVPTKEKLRKYKLTKDFINAVYTKLSDVNR